MADIPSELRNYAEEGLYVLVGASITGAFALRRRLAAVPVADRAATVAVTAAGQVLDEVAREAITAFRQVRSVVELVYTRVSGAGSES